MTNADLDFGSWTLSSTHLLCSEQPLDGFEIFPAFISQCSSIHIHIALKCKSGKLSVLLGQMHSPAFTKTKTGRDHLRGSGSGQPDIVLILCAAKRETVGLGVV